MTALTVSQPRTLNPQAVAAQTHAEAGELATAELARLLDVIAAIDDDKWHEPTDCTLWDVRQMVAHLGGACAGWTSLPEFTRQYVRNPVIKQYDELIDAINNLQVADRADRTTAEVIAELRTEGPRAIRVRQRLPWILRQVRLPLGPLGWAPIGYLTDTIYTRDWWMHRADLCRATGQRMVLTPEHDGRLVALMMADLADKLARERWPHTVDLALEGDITPVYRFGDKAEPDATVSIDLVEFNRLASGRIPLDEALRGAVIDGDTAAGRALLANCEIPY